MRHTRDDGWLTEVGVTIALNGSLGTAHRGRFLSKILQSQPLRSHATAEGWAVVDRSVARAMRTLPKGMNASPKIVHVRSIIED